MARPFWSLLFFVFFPNCWFSSNFLSGLAFCYLEHVLGNLFVWHLSASQRINYVIYLMHRCSCHLCHLNINLRDVVFSVHRLGLGKCEPWSPVMPRGWHRNRETRSRTVVRRMKKKKKKRKGKEEWRRKEVADSCYASGWHENREARSRTVVWKWGKETGSRGLLLCLGMAWE